MLDSLYIHVPFCSEKCDYCAFYSLPTLDLSLQQSYLNHLVDEMRSKAGNMGPLRSVFIGGGTPSALAPTVLAALLESVTTLFTFTDDYEFSMESNPASLTAEQLGVATDGGVNRISVGIQSFSQKSRRAIGRCGDIRNVYKALDALHSHGITNFNCDMIYGIAGQTLDEWQRDLKELITFRPAHVSAYSLIIEEGTVLARQEPDGIEDELYLDMWHATDAILGEIGIKRYEISNFSTAGRECRHNWDIWHGRPFAAVGPAAHSFNGTERLGNTESLQGWLKGTPPSVDAIPQKDRAVEILIIGLRTCSGWSRAEFTGATGYDYMDLRGEELTTLCTAGLLSVTADSIIPTERGLLLNNYLGEVLI